MKTRSRRSAVHADAVAEQRAAGAAPRGIDRDHRDAHVGKLAQEAVEQLVGHELDLPAPPVPVMPTTGVWPRAPVAIACAGARVRLPPGVPPRCAEHAADRDLVVEIGMVRLRDRRRAADARARITSSIIATRPMCMPSFGW
jgi:hypothetical protein